MKNHKIPLSFVLVAALVALPLFAISANAQNTQDPNQASALMRGYRTGYSDGYPAGRGDAARQGARDFQAKAEYQRADRAYSSAFGSLDEYRDGYRQGFGAGYIDGYDRRSFDSTVPPDLKRRAQSDEPDSPLSPPVMTNAPASVMSIQRDTIMRVELLSNLSTDASQKGDRFQARVLEPNEYEGAIVSGEVAAVKRPGKAKGTAELQLAFDEIRMADGRSAKMSAQVIEVLPTGASQGVGKVDSEGGVSGKDSTKEDVAKVGAATGIGAVIGAIFGGGSGAAVGAAIGAGVGTAGVLRQRGKDIYLYQGQQLRIRTAGDADIQ